MNGIFKCLNLTYIHATIFLKMFNPVVICRILTIFSTNIYRWVDVFTLCSFVSKHAQRQIVCRNNVSGNR